MKAVCYIVSYVKEHIHPEVIFGILFSEVSGLSGSNKVSGTRKLIDTCRCRSSSIIYVIPLDSQFQYIRAKLISVASFHV